MEMLGWLVSNGAPTTTSITTLSATALSITIKTDKQLNILPQQAQHADSRNANCLYTEPDYVLCSYAQYCFSSITITNLNTA